MPFTLSRGFLLFSLVLLFVPGASAEDQGNSAAELATTGRRLEGVGKLKWTDGMCTFIGSLNACLNYVGEKTTYPYLMGVSGAAFATRFHPAWSASSADAALDDRHASFALAAVGYSYSWSDGGREAVVRGIDAGVPVVAAGLSRSNHWGLVTGYRFDGESFLCRWYGDESDDYSASDKVPSNALVLLRRREAPSIVRGARDSVARAVGFARGDTEPKDAGYAAGFAAMDAWIEALRSRRLRSMSGKDLESTATVNAWLFNSLIDARYAAVTYLNWVATVAKGDARASCAEAASLYGQEVDVLKEARACVRYPQNVASGPKWSVEMRACQAEALRNALVKERAAVEALERALADPDGW